MLVKALYLSEREEGELRNYHFEGIMIENGYDGMRKALERDGSRIGRNLNHSSVSCNSSRSINVVTCWTGFGNKRFNARVVTEGLDGLERVTAYRGAYVVIAEEGLIIVDLTEEDLEKFYERVMWGED